MSESPAPRYDADLSPSGATDGTPLPLFNAGVIQVPFPVTVMLPFAPFQLFPHHGHAIDTKVLWKSAPAAAGSNLRSLQQLSKGRAAQSPSPQPGGPNPGRVSPPPSATPASTPTPSEANHDFVVVTGHHLGHLLVWDLDRNTLVGSCLHFNNATVSHIVVTTSFIYSVVEKQNGRTGQSGDDIDIYVWRTSNLHLVEKLAAHEDRVTGICVDDNNERRLASGGADHLVFLWDLSQKKNSAVPIGKVELPHGHSVSQVRLFGNVLVTGSGDGEVRLWNVADPAAIKCLQVFDGHQGQVVHLSWFVRPSVGNHFQGILCTACTGGLVRGWYCSTDDEEEGKGPSMEQSFFNKAHKAMVTDVVCDGDIVVSCSSSDGLNFFHSQQKTNYKTAGVDGGVRCLCVDPKRELVIAGTDKGQLFFFDYSNFVRPSRFHEDPVSLVATFQPHVGSITAILLEQGISGDWSRLVTTSADGTVFKMDFELTRDARTLGTLMTSINGVVRTPQGNYCLPLQSTGTGAAPALGLPGAGAVALYSGETVTPCFGNQTKTDGKVGTRVVSMQFCEDTASLVVAFDDSTVKSYAIRHYVDDALGSVVEWLQPLGAPPGVDLNPYQVRLLSPMPTGTQLTAVSMVKGINSRNGYITTLDAGSDPLMQTTDVATLPLPCVALALHPYLVRVHSGTAEDPNAITDRRVFVVVCQLRNGEIHLLSGAYDSRTLQLLRIVVRDQLGGGSLGSETSQLSLDSVASRWPMPCRFLSSILTKYEPPRVNLVYVEGMRNLRSIETSCGVDSVTPCQFTAVFNFDVLQVCALNQGVLAFAVCVDSSTAYVTGSRGEVLFEVQYDGDVVDTVVAEAHHANARAALSSVTSKKKRTLIPESVSPSGGPVYARRYPQCCLVSFAPDLRLVVFGYRDGLIQLWDVNTHRVCYRIHAHASPITNCWIFGEQRKLFTTATNGSLRVDTIWPKTLRDAKNNTSATPATTPISQTLALGGAAPPLVLL